MSATKYLGMALSCALVIAHLTWHSKTFLQNFCKCKERKWNKQFTRLFFPSICKKWPGNQTTSLQHYENIIAS